MFFQFFKLLPNYLLYGCDKLLVFISKFIVKLVDRGKPANDLTYVYLFPTPRQQFQIFGASVPCAMYLLKDVARGYFYS